MFLLRWLGRWVRSVIIALGSVALIGGLYALADYQLTQGTGTTFSSKVISTVNYAASLLCDATSGSSQCAAVNSSGSVQVDELTSSQFHTDMTAPVPSLASTAWNTNTYSNAATVQTSSDLHGNFWVDVGAVGGSALALGQTTMSASIPVVLPSNQAAIPVTASNSDPCFGNAKTTANLSTSSSGTQIVAGTSAKKTYVCSVTLFSSAIANISFEEGTTTCTVGTAATYLNNSTTAANGAYMLAGGGFTLGNGQGTVFSTNTNANNLCILFTTGNTPQVNVSMTYVQQ